MSSPPRVKNLLPFVRKGSKGHLLRLADNWPEEPSSDLIAATDAVLLFLASRGQPGERLSLEDLEIAQACFFGISRALRATHPSKSDDPGQHAEMRDKICSLILGQLEAEIFWMGKCIRYSRVLAEENHSIVQGACRLVARCAWTFAQQLTYHEDLKSAMQALPVAARTLSDIWSWTEPVNNIPLCIIGTALKDDFWKGCGIIDSMYIFTQGCDDATLLVLGEVLRTKPHYKAAANEFVRLSTDRVQMLEQACRAPKKNPPLILKSLTHVMRIVTNFVLCGDHYIMRALQKKPFIHHFMSTLFLVSTHLWAGCRNPMDLPSSECLSPLQLVHDVLPLWTNAFPSATYVMRELLDADMNLPLLLLSTIAYFQDYDIYDKCPGDFPRRGYLLYRATLEWIATFALYPSLANDLFCSFRDTGSELQKVFCSKYGDQNVRIWQGFTAFLGRRAEQHKHNLRTDLCDNISHVPTSQPPIASRQRSCSACHSVLYCSERCQSEDWESGHREDCQYLLQVYVKRKRNHRWLTGSMRLALLKVVEADFLRCTHASSSSLSVVVMDFTKALNPGGSETKPISEFTQALLEKEDVRGIGARRIDALAREVRINPHMRIVSAAIPYHGSTLRVVARIHIPLIGKAALISGFDFIQTIPSPSPFPPCQPDALLFHG